MHVSAHKSFSLSNYNLSCNYNNFPEIITYRAYHYLKSAVFNRFFVLLSLAHFLGHGGNPKENAIWHVE